ncbi:MAG: glycosyltransferase family 2 protein [Candidatus Promineofilum sp.]|nr:glycosyltransferase family 2 protein [Promineifilum sp.]
MITAGPVSLTATTGANSLAPRVSIITATYNHARWIGACIESVQAQTFQNWEQIIIDDGSSDDTAAVIQRYLDDPRINYIRQENRGIWHLADNNNVALAIGLGEFVAILEGDDRWPPDKLESQLSAFDDDTIGLCYGWVQVIDDQDVLVESDILRSGAWSPPYASLADTSPLPFLRDLLLLRGNVGNVSVMYRRAALDAAGGFWQPSYFPAADFSTHLRVATCYRAAFLDQPLGFWRKHSGQTTEIHALRYALGHTQTAVEYWRSLPEPVRLELGIEEQDIWSARRAYLANAYWGATRAAMHGDDWATARAYAANMFKWGDMFRKVEGTAAWLFSLLHIDINSAIDWAAGTSMGKRLVR